MSESLTSQLHRLLLEEGLQPERLPNSIVGVDDAHAATPNDEHIHSMRLPVQGKNAEWTCLIRVFEKTERILVYSIFPTQVADAQRPQLALMLTQINYGLILGNFEFDLSDGEIRYKTSIDVEGIALNSTLLRNLLYGNFFSVDLYYHALTKAIEGDDDLQQLIQQAEHPDDIRGFDLVDDLVH